MRHAESGRHSARYALVQAHARAAALIKSGLAPLERQVEPAVVSASGAFFEYLETKAYKMHPGAAVQVPQLHQMPHLRRCAPEDRGLLWRIGTKAQADAVFDAFRRFMPSGLKWS